MKRKSLPALIMLLAGAIASILMVVNHYTLKSLLGILLVVLIVFYILGSILKIVLDKFEAQQKQLKEEQEQKDGEVIEKEASSAVDESESVPASDDK